jgi:similar to stage IV sporulation protein
MKNQWMNFFSGSVKIKVSGKGIERFLNECVRNGILIWDVKKPYNDSCTCNIYLRDISKIRPLVRNSDCRLRFIGKKGLPFLIRRTLLNSGFLIGALLFLSIITFLSNMIWGIQVEGAKPETEHLLRKELTEIGVQKGKFQFLIEDVESIQKQLTDNIDAITWVGVELKGTTYHFQVVEKNQPENPEYLSPRHLVAKKKAVITDMFVEEGMPLVAVNDHVTEGQVLVSGEIGKEGQTKSVPARGKIFGETWYKSDVMVELSTKFNVFTGNYKTKHYINFWGWSLPIWGFGKNEFKSFETESHEKSIRFIKWNSPVTYSKVTIRENEEVERNYTVEQAKEVAKQYAMKKLEDELDEDAKIKGEKVLHQSHENGKVRLSIHYQVIENIVTSIPLVQGD